MSLSNGALILVAGAGWRVWRFIVPALLAEGVARERIVLWRRSMHTGLHPLLAQLRATTRPGELAPGEVGLTLNCVPAGALVAVQALLMERFGAALHFCDTPILSEESALPAVERLSAGRVYSLEDWPLMPNLGFFTKALRGAKETADLRIERFGIATHFLALYRAMCGGGVRQAPSLAMEGDLITGAPWPGAVVSFRAGKDLPVSKTFLRADGQLIEDFHEAEPRPHGNEEVLYRVVEGECVRYHRGPEEISAHALPHAILEGFAPFADRKNIHELDKVIGLMTLFRAVLARDCALAYGYMSSARDVIASRNLAAGHRCTLI